MNANLQRLEETTDAIRLVALTNLQRLEGTTDAHLRRVEDMLLGKFAELDGRLSRIEAHLELH